MLGRYCCTVLIISFGVLQIRGNAMYPTPMRISDSPVSYKRRTNECLRLDNPTQRPTTMDMCVSHRLFRLLCARTCA